MNAKIALGSENLTNVDTARLARALLEETFRLLRIVVLRMYKHEEGQG
jgi:hypothetical protein